MPFLSLYVEKNKTQCQTIFVMDCLLAFYDIKGSHEINYESTND